MSLAAAPILAVMALGAGAADTGMLSAAQSLPFLLLSLSAGVPADRMRRRRLMVAAGMLASIGGRGMAWPVASFFLFGFGPILWTIGQTTWHQAVTPQAMLGRVFALFMMAGFGARPVGAALGGHIGERFGLGWALVLAAAGFGIQALIVLASPIRPLRALPETAACAIIMRLDTSSKRMMIDKTKS